MPKKGLYANIHAKRERIKAGSGERMRKPGESGAPTKSDFKRSATTAKKKQYLKRILYAKIWFNWVAGNRPSQTPRRL